MKKYLLAMTLISSPLLFCAESPQKAPQHAKQPDIIEALEDLMTQADPQNAAPEVVAEVKEKPSLKKQPPASNTKKAAKEAPSCHKCKKN